MRRHLPRVLLLLALSACGHATANPQATPATGLDVGPAPAPAPARLASLIGEYGLSGRTTHMVLEDNGTLVLRTPTSVLQLTSVGSDVYSAPDGLAVTFTRDSRGRAEWMDAGGMRLPRIAVGPESGNQLVVTPVRPISELRREALAASPPVESGPFRPSDLVELTQLDPTIKLEIRYATSNNLFGTPFYTQARAFMQRAPAEAVVRANASLKPMGFGLLIHDGYRPWYVTKMFWEGAPLDKRIFVANPAEGSKHNRGAAVDLSMYDLKTGAPVDMVSTYDETTSRAAANYPGGTSLQRWHRLVLRRAMEAQRFGVNPTEWWHFDFADWRDYAIGVVRFEDIGAR